MAKLPQKEQFINEHLRNLQQAYARDQLLQEFGLHVKKTCPYIYEAVETRPDPETGEPVRQPMSYRRGDLYEWAKEAFAEGKSFFHAKPVNPGKPYGKLVKCDPEYYYHVSGKLTEEEMLAVYKALEEYRNTHQDPKEQQ